MICGLLAMAVPAALAIGVSIENSANAPTQDGPDVGGGVSSDIGDVGPDPGFACEALSEGASNSSASWNALVGGPEGDHALVDDDGAVACSDCGFDGHDDLDLLGDEGQKPSVQQDSTVHADLCE